MWSEEIADKVADVDLDIWLRIVRLMVLSRTIDERLIRCYHQGKIRGSVFASIGQEAIGAATVVAAQPEDLFSPCIRNLPVHLGRGESTLRVLQQALGKADGPTGGRDGNVHYGTLENGVYTMISHLGAMLSVVAGGVMARRLQGDDSIGIAYIGDGGTSTGDFHEAVNFAAVFDVPLLVVIENNHFAYSTPSSRQYRCEHLMDRAKGYGIDGYLADGNNAGEMYVTARDIMTDIRANPRPVLLECLTMRMRGHGEHDSFPYVPKKLIDAYTRRDPIKMAVRGLKSVGLISDADEAELKAAVSKDVDDAYQIALNSPDPAPETLKKGVYTHG